MKRQAFFAGLMALCAALPAAAEIYRWVDDTGRVHFTDQPPPNVKKVQQVPGASGPGDPNPSKLREATLKSPITLYSANSSDCGQPCTDAENYLKGRGVPYKVRMVDRDYAASQDLKKLVGGNSVPTLSIGSSTQRGFDKGMWDNLLNLAGYPAPKAPPAAIPNPPPSTPAPATPGSGNPGSGPMPMGSGAKVKS